MEGRKRKRENDGVQAVITFFAPNDRIFDRVFRDGSLEDMKNGIKNKLRISEDTDIKLVQLRDGRNVDLEDDDDFEALRAQAAIYHSLQVKITISEHTSQLVDRSDDVSEDHHSAKKKRVSFGEVALSQPGPVSTPSRSPPLPHTPSKSLLVPFLVADGTPAEPTPQAKQKRKRKKSLLSVVEEEAGISTSMSPPVVASDTSGKRKQKDSSPENQISVFTSEESGITPSKKKRRKKDLATDTLPSAPSEVTSATGPVHSTLPPPKVQNQQEQKSKEVAIIETREPQSSDNHVNEKEANKASKKKTKSKSVQLEKRDDLQEKDELHVVSPEAPLNPADVAKKPSKERKQKGISTPSESLPIPHSSIPTPQDPDILVKPKKSRSRRQKESLPPAPDVNSFPKPHFAEGASDTSSNPSKQPSNSTPRTTPPSPKLQTNQSNPPTWSIPCPICRQPSFHYHYACPIVLGDSEQLKRRVSEMRKEGHDTKLMQVMEGYLTNKRSKGTEGSAVVPAPAGMASPPSQPAESSQKDSDTLIDKPRDVPEEAQHQGAGNATESSESQSSSSSEKVQSKHPKRKAVKATPSISPSHIAQIDTETQLESLLRGPVRSSRSVLAAIPSGSEGSDHEDGMESEDPDQEDEENDKSFRRLEKRLQRANSSSDEEPAAEEGESSASPKTPLPQGSDESSSSTPEAEAIEDIVRVESGATSPGHASSTSPEAEDPTGPQDTVHGNTPEKDKEKSSSQSAVAQAPVALSSHPIQSEGMPSTEGDSSPRNELRTSPNTESGTNPRESSQEDPNDPIESADDLIEKEVDAAHDEDPIEQDSSVQEAPPSVVRQSSVIKAMKGRRGQKTSQDANAPVLAATVVPSEARPARPKRGSKKDENPPVNGDQKDAATVPVSDPASSQKPSSSVLMPPPTSVASAAEPKKRGRRPMSQEEKDKRDAAKKAEKAEKAAERAAARAAAKAERDAKKLVEKAEKAKSSRKAVPAKPKRTSTASEKVGQVHTPDPAEPSSSLPIAPDSERTAEPPKTPQNQLPQPSQGSVKWAVLSQTPDLESSMLESSMVDELRSSSPPISVDLPPLSAPSFPKSSKSKAGLNGKSHQNPQTPVPMKLNPSQFVTPLTQHDPLFLPGTQSQFPDISMQLPTQTPLSPSEFGKEFEGDSSSQPSTTKNANWAVNAKFPRLTELSSQVLFSPPAISSTPVARPGASRLTKLSPADESEASETSSEDSSSDDDEEPGDKSNHIPNNRRAGAGIPKKKKGLLSALT